MTLRIEIDGEHVDTCALDDFLASNETLTAEETATLTALAIGETYSAGGGAAVEWLAKRVA